MVAVAACRSLPGTAARFSHPQGLALDAKGVLHLAEHGTNTIRRVL